MKAYNENWALELIEEAKLEDTAADTNSGSEVYVRVDSNVAEINASINRTMVSNNVSINFTQSIDNNLALCTNLVNDNLVSADVTAIAVPQSQMKDFVINLHFQHPRTFSLVEQNRIKLVCINPLPSHRFYFKSDYEDLFRDIENEVGYECNSVIFYDACGFLTSEIEPIELRQFRDFRYASAQTHLELDLITAGCLSLRDACRSLQIENQFS